MQYYELLWLAEQAKSHKVIVEVGSFLGRTTCALAQHTEGLVYAFDNWLGPTDVTVEEIQVDGVKVSTGSVTMRSLVENNNINLFAQFQANTEGLDNIRVIRGDHRDSSVIPADLVPDMVFIDGDHSYENARDDMLFWKEKIAPGGLLCGHDASMDGVFRALMEVLPSRWKFVALTDIWSVNGL